jgi:hypothetical protein
MTRVTSTPTLDAGQLVELTPEFYVDLRAVLPTEVH